MEVNFGGEFNMEVNSGGGFQYRGEFRRRLTSTLTVTRTRIGIGIPVGTGTGIPVGTMTEACVCLRHLFCRTDYMCLTT